MNSHAARRIPLRLDALLTTVLLLLAASGAQAQVWTETGDAGNLPSSSQSTLGTGSLFSINGSLASPTDVDVYCVRLPAAPPAGLPLIQLQCAYLNGPNVWLFDATGKGVSTNQSCAGGNKTIVAPPASLPAGTYYVAVSYSGVGPQSGAGQIWVPLLTGQRSPDGSGAAQPVASWAGTPMEQPINPYHLSLSNMSYDAAAVPTLRSTWSWVKSHYR